MSKTVWIGIDPDIERSGVALWRNKKLEIYRMGFFELFTYLRRCKKGCQEEDSLLKVRLEAGWLNKKSNWHNEEAGVRVASRVGNYIGANHQTGKLIEEMCKYLEIPCELVRPSTSKMDATKFMMMTKFAKRTNQDMRDAALLVYGF